MGMGMGMGTQCRALLGLHRWLTTSPLAAPRDTWRSSALTNILAMSMFNSVMRCMPMLRSDLQVD